MSSQLNPLSPVPVASAAPVAHGPSPTPPARLNVPLLPTASSCRRIASESLLAGDPEVELFHAGQIYRLRRTSTGKLILTK